MGSNRNKKIPKPNIKGDKSAIIVNDFDDQNLPIRFSFRYFCGHSIASPNFNNFYKNRHEAAIAAANFFSTLQAISKLTKKELFSPPNKKQFHLNQLSNAKIINTIESILIDGYGLPQKLVEEFEQTYFEFSFNDGRRVISLLSTDTFYILFIDCNHMVCSNVSRNVAEKTSYSTAGLFDIQDSLSINEEKQNNKIELVRILVEEIKTGKISSTDDIITNLESVLE